MKKLKYIILTMFALTILIGCKKQKIENTTIEVVDNNRHYYPVLQGQEKTMVFPLINKGEHPFLLTDMIVSCGCIIAKKESLMRIPAGGEGKLILKFDTTKNVGFVKHYVTLYGNFANTDKIEVSFDLNVVPDAHYTKDYEELFQEHKADNVKDLVDGKIDRDYYLDLK